MRRDARTVTHQRTGAERFRSPAPEIRGMLFVNECAVGSHDKGFDNIGRLNRQKSAQTPEKRGGLRRQVSDYTNVATGFVVPKHVDLDRVIRAVSCPTL